MKGRIFTPEFKLGMVRAVLSGEKSVVQLCREHSISDSCIHNWKKLYREKGEAAFREVERDVIAEVALREVAVDSVVHDAGLGVVPETDVVVIEYGHGRHARASSQAPSTTVLISSRRQ